MPVVPIDTWGSPQKEKKHQPAMPLLLNMIMPSVIVAMIMRVQCSTIYYIYIFIVIYNNKKNNNYIMCLIVIYIYIYIYIYNVFRLL